MSKGADTHDIQESELRFRFETLVSDLTARFVNVVPDQVDAEIVEAQRRVCECLGLDLSVLWEWQIANPGVLLLTHLYCPPGFPPHPEQMDASEYFPWCLRKLVARETVVLSSIQEAPVEAARDVESWRQFGVKTSLTIPLWVGSEPPFGAISFNDLTTARAWAEPLVKRLELIARVFANAIIRKRSEQLLREREEQLSMALEAAGVGAWNMDAKSRQVWASAGERNLFGYQADETLTMDSFLNLIHPDDRESVREAVEKALRTKTPLFEEYRIVRRDGSVRWISARGHPRYSPEKELERMAGISVDITDRKRREESLRFSEARIASAVEAAGVGFYELDARARFHLLDDRIRALLGAPAEEESRIREYWLAHIHPEDLPEILRMSSQIFEGGLDRAETEYRYMHPSRGLLWFHHLSRAIERDAAGGIIRIVGVIRDITEGKEREATEKRLRDEIAHLTRVTTMGVLTSALAHELNQPLAAIMNNAHAARRMIASGLPHIEDFREIIGDIIADDERAGDIIRHMRDLLRKDEPVLRPLAVNEVIGEAARLVRSDALIKGIRISLDLAPELPPVRSDRIQLQQVLLNLIFNACEAMKDAQGERALTVKTTWLPADGVVVAVQDSGPGIPQEKMETIFAPFYTSKAGGLGMGLAICRTIITSLGGRIWAENDGNRGAIIQFNLPAVGVSAP